MKEKYRGSDKLNNKKVSFYSLSSKLKQDELINLEKAKELILQIKEKYNFTFEDINKLIGELSFPIEIFNEKLTVLESIVKYLKEERNFSLRKISNLIGRDERNIWGIYNESKKKYPKKFVVKRAGLWVPVSILSNIKLSALESIVFYLHDDLDLKFSQIAGLLRRDQRTIWTSYSRARKKNVKQK